MNTATAPHDDRPPTLSQALGSAAAIADGGLDVMLGLLRVVGCVSDVDTLQEPEMLRQALADAERLERRACAVKLALIELARRGQVPERAGFAGTGQWLARATRTNGRRAHQLALLAQDLPRLPVARQALQAGELSQGHAEVIADTCAQLPAELPADSAAHVEAHLVRLARELDPTRLRRQARRALEAVQPDPAVVDAHEDTLIENQEDQAREAASFWLRDNDDGTMTGHFTVPTFAGLVLRKIIDAMTAPRRTSGGPVQDAGNATRDRTAAQDRRATQDHGEATAAQPGPAVLAETADWKVRNQEWQHRRGLAFAELLEHLPTEKLSNKVAATVLVHLDLQTLTRGLRRAGRTDLGDRVSAGTARKLACQAGIVPVVLGADSAVLDLGETSRLFSEAQRLALSVKYTECAAEGCDRPFAWCELHHLRPWAAFRRSNLEDALPLCGTHHREIDRPGSSHTFRPGPDKTLIVAFHRRT